jgi:NADH-quinone oxidoreductase subunit J
MNWNRDLVLASIVILLGGVGTWLLLPHRHGKVKSRSTQALGTVLAVLALFVMGGFYTPPGAFLQSAFFYAFATAALSGAILTITCRNPIYSALWFASVVLSTSGLFLLAGAQFLAAGTIIVYAGAIIVTFLFVIMLAQSEGQAIYDRMARAPGAATLSGFGLLWALFYALIVVQTTDGPAKEDASVRRLVPATALVSRDTGDGKARTGSLPGDGPDLVLARAIRPTALLGPASSTGNGDNSSHVAGLGATLFTDHLIAVELAGALLFVALVGAISMATPRPPIRPATTAPDPAQAKNLATASASF